jgi:hypothetical protein
MSTPYDTGRPAEVADHDLAAVRSHTDVARIVEHMLDDRDGRWGAEPGRRDRA